MAQREWQKMENEIKPREEARNLHENDHSHSSGRRHFDSKINNGNALGGATGGEMGGGFGGDAHNHIQHLHTTIAVDAYAHHRNACDQIHSCLDAENADYLQSPLKGSRCHGSGVTLAEKRAAVVDRTAKRNVVNDEKRRNRVRRKVAEEIGGRGVAFRQAFKQQFSGSGHISFNEYKSNMQSLGVVLSDEDFCHLWDLCSTPQRGSGSAPQHLLGAYESPSFASSTGYSHGSVPVTRLAEVVGITEGDAFIGSKDKEQERKYMKKAAMAGQKLANNLKGRKKHLRQALVVSDVHQTGVVRYDEFKSCLTFAGVLIGDADCKVCLPV